MIPEGTLRRAMLNLARYAGWSLGELKEMEIRELARWLETAREMIKESGPGR